jgi:hypothetical protein
MDGSYSNSLCAGERAPGAPFGVNSLKAMNVASSYFEKAGFNVWAEELKALAGGKEEYALSLEQDKIVLKAFGTARHAGYPEGSVNATKLAAELLAQSHCINGEDRACMEQLAFWLNDYHGINIGIAHEDPDFGKLSSANGIVKMQNGRISFTLDIRFGVSQDHLQTEAELAQFFEAAGWSFTCLNNRKDFIADKNSPIPETFTNIYHELTGSETIPYYMFGGIYSHILKTPLPLAPVHILPSLRLFARLCLPAMAEPISEMKQSLLKGILRPCGSWFIIFWPATAI